MDATKGIGYLDHRLADFFFSSELVGRSLTHGESREWRTEARNLDELPGAPFYRLRTEKSDVCVALLDQGDVMLDEGDVIVQAGLSGGEISVAVAAKNENDVRVGMATLRDIFPEAKSGEARVPITFWSYGQHGSQSSSRMIDVPPWEDVTDNYASSVRRRLAEMMDDFRPAFGGQLILWHGPPGTGKTWALRALAWEWREWADFHYIVDPDKFFGEHADYLLDVLLHGDSDGYRDEGDGYRDEDEKKWLVLLLEDTGEMLSADARERTGQGLSRLLNVVDGLIGQGLKVLALITTNEEIKKLHPAVARPGRCAALINFEPLSAAEVHEWLVAHDHDPGAYVPKQMTLADLYAAVNDYERVEVSSVGFG